VMGSGWTRNHSMVEGTEHISLHHLILIRINNV
jgi:hypothetical protein